MLLVDFDSHKVVENNELKARIANQYPYKEWLDNHKVDLNLEGQTYHQPLLNSETLFELQRQFGYTKEDIYKYMAELVKGKKDPIGAMGYDAPLAVLNERPESLFNYFKQLFAQVTNPPIDAYREKIVTSELSYLGGEGNLFHPDETVLDRIQLAKPVLTLTQLDKIKQSKFNVKHLSTLYQDNLKRHWKDWVKRRYKLLEMVILY